MNAADVIAELLLNVLLVIANVCVVVDNTATRIAKLAPAELLLIVLFCTVTAKLSL